MLEKYLTATITTKICLKSRKRKDKVTPAETEMSHIL